jgi:hypothetical protein
LVTESPAGESPGQDPGEVVFNAGKVGKCWDEGHRKGNRGAVGALWVTCRAFSPI